MAVTIVQGITATPNETGATFTGGAITNSTIDNSPIGGVTPSTGSFTTVSAQTGVFAGDVAVSGKVTVGQAVSAASLNAVGVVSAGGDVNSKGNLVVGARAAVVSGDTGNITGAVGSFTTVSANSAGFNGDVTVSGKVTVGQAVSAASFNATGVVSAGGDVNTKTNFIAGSRAVVVSGDSGTINGSALSLSGIVSATSVNVTGDVRALTGAVLASAATFTAAVTANSLHVNTTVSAAGDINTATNFVAGARTVVVSGDSGNITATGKVDITGAVSAASGHFTGAVSAASIYFTSTTGVVGTTTNDGAAAGSVGEFLSSTVLQAAGSGLSTATAKTVTFVTLTPGDWDVRGVVEFTGGTTTTITYAGGSISTLPNSVQDSGSGYTINFLNNATVFLTTNPIAFNLAPVRFSVNTSTAAYLNAVASFGASVCSAYGGIQARRVR